MLKPLESFESHTRNERMTSTKRLPRNSITDFNLHDSRHVFHQNASLPRTASHIYTLQKGLYGSTTNFSNDLTQADSASPATMTLGGTLTGKPDFIRNSHDLTILDSPKPALGLSTLRNHPRTATARKEQDRLVFSDTPLNDTYMAMVAASHASIMSRHDLDQARGTSTVDVRGAVRQEKI